MPTPLTARTVTVSLCLRHSLHHLTADGCPQCAEEQAREAQRKAQAVREWERSLAAPSLLADAALADWQRVQPQGVLRGECLARWYQCTDLHPPEGAKAVIGTVRMHEDEVMPPGGYVNLQPPLRKMLEENAKLRALAHEIAPLDPPVVARSIGGAVIREQRIPCDAEGVEKLRQAIHAGLEAELGKAVKVPHSAEVPEYWKQRQADSAAAKQRAEEHVARIIADDDRHPAVDAVLRFMLGHPRRLEWMEKDDRRQAESLGRRHKPEMMEGTILSGGDVSEELHWLCCSVDPGSTARWLTAEEQREWNAAVARLRRAVMA